MLSEEVSVTLSECLRLGAEGWHRLQLYGNVSTVKWFSYTEAAPNDLGGAKKPCKQCKRPRVRVKRAQFAKLTLGTRLVLSLNCEPVFGGSARD